MTDFSQRVIDIISSVPEGRVASYGRIAEIAGNPRAARQVSRLLHSSSEKHNLPWHRIINSAGRISLKGEHAIIQRGLLESEGIEFGISGDVNMSRYGI
ncbi:MAG TPA: DNA methyltransferase [Spirochaeta sp.]|nr:DNA methyltransferase [Spirochaeta sp.]